MTGEWWRRQQLHYINMKLSMERSDAAMSLSRRTDKSIFLFNWDKRKRRKFEMLRYSHAPVYLIPTHTWRIQSHSRQEEEKKNARNSIVRNDIIRPGLSICTISSQVNLSESSSAHVSSSKIRTSSIFSSPATHNESIKVARSDSFISTICSSSNEISTYSLKTLRGIPDGIVCSPRLLQSTFGPWQEQTDGHASATDGCWNNRRI